MSYGTISTIGVVFGARRIYGVPPSLCQDRMIFERTEEHPGARFLFILACLVVVVYGLKAAAPILLPTAMALFLAVLSLPMMLWLSHHKVPAGLATVITVLIFVSLVGLLILAGSSSVTVLQANLDLYQDLFVQRVGAVIDWADSFAASRVMYLSLPSILPEEFAEAIALQQPLRAVQVKLEGGPAIAGDWILDAHPRFSSPDGRFLGFAGGMRRALEAEEPGNHSDRLRQLLHELRTPVNAIQGFAEVIQQQVVGPVPHDYRALAAGIAGDSARMLAGFDDLERLSGLESGQLRPAGGDADIAAIFRQHVAQLIPMLQPRSASFVATLGGVCKVDLARADAELLSWRILATLGSAAAPSEKLALTLETHAGTAQLIADLPASLNGSDDIFAARGKPLSVAISAGPFGPGFALRLARAEALAIGGSLRRENRQLILTLPALTASEPAANQRGGVPEHAV